MPLLPPQRRTPRRSQKPRRSTTSSIQPFVVNFGGEGSTRYLQVTVEAMSRDAGILEVLKNNEPAVRNDLVHAVLEPGQCRRC